MSAEAVAYVYRYSPYRGATFQLHHAIADSANDQNDFLVWLGVAKLGFKARLVPRSVIAGLAKLTKDEFLELVDGQHGQARGATYRMLFPEVPVMYDSLDGRTASAKRSLVKSTTSAIDDTHSCNPPRPLMQMTVSSPYIEPKEPKEPKRARSVTRDELFEALCAIDRIDWHKATPKELGRVRSVRKGLAKVEATVDQIRSVKAAMENAGWKPQMITSSSIESNFSKFLTESPKSIAPCKRCSALCPRKCHIYPDCPQPEA